MRAHSDSLRTVFLCVCVFVCCCVLSFVRLFVHLLSCLFFGLCARLLVCLFVCAWCLFVRSFVCLLV